MFKKIIFLFFIVLSVSEATGQEKDAQEPLYINLFINANRTIFVETDETGFNDVKTKVSSIVRNMPFKIDQRIVYRIFADENLDLGYIMDVDQEMLNGYGHEVQTLRYLLNTSEMKIDGQNWFESIDMNSLQKKM